MSVVRRFLVVCAILAIPAVGYAQEAVLNGTLTDSTGGVLPGVTVTAVNEATGNSFVAVSDSGGRYRIQVRTGAYKLMCELSGFSTVTRTGIQLLLGQTATIDVQLKPSGVSESITVTGETPLVNTTSSTLGGNVDPRQVAELPVAGRNFMALALLAPGSRTQTMNATQPLPDRGRAQDVREFQINLDGQQVTRDIGTGSQPKYSQDMISEFQYVANRFDATMGRSSGVLVNIITKSGTNLFSGVVRGNYRSGKLNSEEPVLKKVLPIDNTQISTAVGGPIMKDKLHFFVNGEYEREPTTSAWNTAYPFFNITLNGTATQKKGGARIDYQLSEKIRLMVKGSDTRTSTPFGAGGADHPAGTSKFGDYNNEGYARMTWVISSKAVNEIEGGRAVYGLDEQALTSWSKHWLQGIDGTTNGSPRVRFTTFNITQNRNLPRNQAQWYWNVRDNFTYSYDAAGRHDLRAGAEYLWRHQLQYNRLNSSGEIDARKLPTPSAAQLQAWFPVWDNVDTWCLDCLAPYTRTILIGVGNFNNNVYSQKLAAWVQDDWKVSNRLTLNLGVRYDAEIGAFANVNFPPWESTGNYNDWNNFQPRVGFAWRVNERTVVRGGVGLYIAGATSGDETRGVSNTIQNVIQFTNDGRPDFVTNPANGPLPTYEQSNAMFCHNNNNAPGCLLLTANEVIMNPKYEKLGENWQTSLGVQHQIGETIGVELDWIYNHSANEKGIIDNANVTYDPATGAPYPFSDRTKRAFPNWGTVNLSVHTGRSATQEVRASVTKRFSSHWQASGTYSLRWFWDAEPRPFAGIDEVPFPTVPDLGGEYTLGAGDQRHRATFSAIWQVGHGFQVSALQYIGSGVRLATNWGTDVRGLGVDGTDRLRPDGTIVPRNSLVGPAQSRTDLRLQQRIQLRGRVAIDAIAEVFNLLNSPNWTIGTQENRPDYKQHISGEYRTAQVGIRLTF